MKNMISENFYRCPEVSGPVPTSEKSHPFCAMKYSREPLDLCAYGYVEEEFFLAGKACVYDADSENEAVACGEALPYKTRILVRRPSDEKAFSGRVYFDIMNATQGYDIEDLWHRIYLWCMENGHGYVGITSKPVNVMSLKNFDYERYGSLNWGNGQPVDMPVPSNSATIPGTEEGLIWDMLGQTGMLLRTGGSKVMGGFSVKEIYLTGQSQSGAYLNTFISYFDRYAKMPDGSGIFDGYLNIVGALVQRTLKQEGSIGPLRLLTRNMHPCTMPYICLTSEGDLTLFRLFVEGELLDMRIENTDLPGDKCRHYEISGSPHTDIICPVLSSLDEIRKMNGKLPNLDPALLTDINDMHVEFYVCGMLEKLHEWAMNQKAPECYPVLTREGGGLKKDRYGNTEGGFRTPYVDVPIASYTACNPDDPEGICGKMEYFSKDMFTKTYKDREGYLKKFANAVERQVEEGWLSVTDGNKMKNWAEEVSLRYE